MVILTYTKNGTKATTPAKLDTAVFGVEVKNHQLLKDAYLAYLANGRSNFAHTKKRGEVRGGGQKPWRQKGTGRARFGSSRNPIWTGGGVAFGPTGEENYLRKLNLTAKRAALKQALSLAAKENRIKVIEAVDFSSGKVRDVVSLLRKLDAKGNILMLIESGDENAARATRNIPNLRLKITKYLSAHEVLNADEIIIEKAALSVLESWLGRAKKPAKEAANV